MEIRKQSESCTLEECPIGLFMPLDGNELCLKTEYGLDSYIVRSGEKFWGGVNTCKALAKVMVIPCSVNVSQNNGQRVGVIRRFDDLGRIVIPGDIRQLLFGTRRVEGMQMEFFVEKDCIVLKKYVPESEENKDIQNVIAELENLKKCYLGDKDADMKEMSFEEYLQNIINSLKSI